MVSPMVPLCFMHCAITLQASPLPSTIIILSAALHAGIISTRKQSNKSDMFTFSNSFEAIETPANSKQNDGNIVLPFYEAFKPRSKPWKSNQKLH